MSEFIPLNPQAPVPAFNVATIPHEVRHGAIHGALSTREVGQSLILIAPHDPLPLLAEIEQRPETFEVTYLKRGPQDWHLRFDRTA
ncbi:DUF2249 domain-containing protein [Corynebacterium uberis]|uniref:DUF2249 domain-containing protein n=1 Tax=Corynebacterium TaxID=1716 RepID=UPI001D09D18C|nr:MULTISPECIES: DUF2249 domain-containing protein [Corynebacterium]MCZ9309012.1 DUF2249 domain-containing protein [Corynebacterium sp. c6VSa_13]UDL74520.1 DUF2249 domain-containing protein [Corynebacterium uberis]UDL76646.1 DUF2249 domain-containing protein [Corynebacterium uberis]UDL78859.1 DUF2249 domain-containing protein [Corynebacterium uberis]UDL81137.1 DUF2249 domain-containing protein [Corynebacterium uberis]